MFGDPTKEGLRMKWNIIGRSVCGASHVRSGIECQDSLRRIELPDGTVILAVADGHGSERCPYSKTGSKIAVNTFCCMMEKVYLDHQRDVERLASFLNREGETQIARAIVREWKRRVRNRHGAMGREIPHKPDGSKDHLPVYRQYGTTLLGLMLTSTFSFAFQLGDGDIGCVDERGYAHILEPDRLLGIETHSLCQENAWRNAVSSVRRIDHNDREAVAYMLSTDGLSNSYPSDEAFRLACEDYFKMLSEHGIKAVSENLAHWLRETSELGCGDDISLLIAFHGPGEAG